MVNRPHWSYSQISTYIRCPLQYFFQYVVGLPRKTVSANMILGSAVHKGLEVYHRSIMANQPIDSQVVQAAFTQSWQNRTENEVVVFPSRKNENELKEQGIELLNLYLHNPPPVNIVAVEQETTAPIHNSQGEYLEKPLVSVADLILKNQNGLKIQDFKTSGRSYSQFEADTSLQATCYVNAAMEVFAEPTGFEFVVLVKTKKPQIQQVEVTRTVDDMGRLGDLIETIERAVEAEVFFPNETPLNCSSCPYRKPCLDWGRPKPNDGNAPLPQIEAA